MSDTAGNNSGSSDPLANAAKRAEKAVTQADPTETEASQDSYGAGFGEIDLGGDIDTANLDLAEPSPQKPSIAKPSLLQDEQWEDDDWASDQPGMAPLEDQAPVSAQSPSAPAAPKTQDKAKPEAHKLRKAALPPKEGSAEIPEQQAPQAQPAQEKEGPFIRVSRPQKPSRDWGPVIKWTSIVLVVAGCIAGAIIGYTKWQKSVKAEQQAQLNALDQGSLQSLKSKAVKKGKLGS